MGWLSPCDASQSNPVCDAPLMRDAYKPLLAGAAVLAISPVLPNVVGALLVVAAALLLGWVLPAQPTRTAILFLAPFIVVRTVMVLVDDASEVGSALVGFAIAAVVMSVFTHLGAALALRRRADAHGAR